MQVINIFPTLNVKEEAKQSAHMFLTHLLEQSDEYCEAVRQMDGYKILDNSVVERGEPVSFDRILEMAEKIGADEIILPDVMGSRKETIHMAKYCIKRLKELDLLGRYKIMAVAQGDTVLEWYSCYDKLLDIDEIDVVGIPKIAGDLVPGGRPQLVNDFCDLSRKQHHLLGIRYSFEELKRYDYPDRIRSVDSCQLSYLALYRLPIDAVRPLGFTVELEHQGIDPVTLNDKLSELDTYLEK